MVGGVKAVILLLVVVCVGCGKDKETQTKTKVADSNSTNSIKELTLREKVVGEYEHRQGEDTIKGIFLENGVHEVYSNGMKAEIEAKWKISKDGELHIEWFGNFVVLRINPDGSLTKTAYINNGKRIEAPKEEQFTAKKTSHPHANPEEMLPPIGPIGSVVAIGAMVQYSLKRKINRVFETPPATSIQIDHDRHHHDHDGHDHDHDGHDHESEGHGDSNETAP